MASRFQRDAQRVLWDVIEGYITPEAAEKNYGVAVRYIGKSEELVKLPSQWVIDQLQGQPNCVESLKPRSRWNSKGE